MKPGLQLCWLASLFATGIHPITDSPNRLFRIRRALVCPDRRRLFACHPSGVGCPSQASCSLHWALRGSRAGLPARPPGRQSVKQRRSKPSPHPRRSDMMLKPIAMLSLIAVSTAGCATDPWLRSDCDWAQPIRPSRRDVLTRQTKEQIAAHNETGARICRWVH
jgi:hypothetical protein